MDHKYRKNTAFLHVAEINQICQGLFKKMNVNAFSYSKIYTDGSRTELWSDIYALEHSFFIKQHISKVYTPDLFNMQKFVIYDYSVQSFPKKTQERISNQLQDQKDLFNHANCLFVIDYQADYTEYCAFYTPVSNHAAVNNYLNNMDELTKFRRFFRHRAKEIITKADRNKLILPWRVEAGIQVEVKEIAEEATDVIKPKILLTTREEEVANLLCAGMTAKESAKVLFVTQKTIEKHIENIKSKSGCNRRIQLINHLNQYYHEK